MPPSPRSVPQGPEQPQHMQMMPPSPQSAPPGPERPQHMQMMSRNSHPGLPESAQLLGSARLIQTTPRNPDRRFSVPAQHMQPIPHNPHLNLLNPTPPQSQPMQTWPGSCRTCQLDNQHCDRTLPCSNCKEFRRDCGYWNNNRLLIQSLLANRPSYRDVLAAAIHDPSDKPICIRVVAPFYKDGPCDGNIEHMAWTTCDVLPLYTTRVLVYILEAAIRPFIQNMPADTSPLYYIAGREIRPSDDVVIRQLIHDVGWDAGGLMNVDGADFVMEMRAWRFAATMEMHGNVEGWYPRYR